MATILRYKDNNNVWQVLSQGPAGLAASVEVGTVSTGAPGSGVVVTNSGTDSDAILDFSFPAPAGVPVGGTVGQVLVKTGSGDYASGWTTLQYVDNSSSQTIGGVKTFTSSPVVPNASFSLAKLIVSGTADSTTFLRGDGTWAVVATGAPSNMVTTDSNQTVGGVKTFSSAPVVPDSSFSTIKITGLDSALANKYSSSNKVPISGILTSGVADATTYLRGDGTWTVVTSGSGIGLPPGITTPAQYTADAAQIIDDADSLTGWSLGLQSEALALDTTNKTQGLSSVKGSFQTQNGGRMGRTFTTAVTVGSAKFLSIDLRWDFANGGSSTISSCVLRVTDNSGVVTDFPMPYRAPGTFSTYSFNLSGITTIKSFFVTQTSSFATGGLALRLYFDNVKFDAVTEFDKAVASGSVVSVLVPPTYDSAQDEAFPKPDNNKVILDLRPNRVWITGLGGVRHLSEYGIDPTGLTEVSASINRVLSEIPSGSTLMFPAGARYWCDRPLFINGVNNVTIDMNGSAIFTKIRRGGGANGFDNNTADNMFSVVDCDDIKIYNGAIFGYRQRTSNGSAMITVAGTPTVSSTTMLLDSINEEVRQPDRSDWATLPLYSRAPLEAFSEAQKTAILATDPKFEIGNAAFFTLSDTSQVSNDVQLIATDFETGRVIKSRIFTVTATPTLYAITWQPPLLGSRTKLSVKKVTATSNTINIHSMVDHGHMEYASIHDQNSGIQIVRSRNVLIQNFIVEGTPTDGLDSSYAENHSVTVRDFISRGNARQGISFNRGNNYLLEDFYVYGAGRSGVDIEPYAADWFVKDITVRNGFITQAFNYAFAVDNWARVFNMNIQNVHVDHCITQSFIVGGSQGGSISDCSIKYSGTSSYSYTISGIDMLISNIRGDKGVDLGGVQKTFDDGSGVKTFSPANNLVDGVRYSSGDNRINRYGYGNVIRNAKFLGAPTYLGPGTTTFFGEDSPRNPYGYMEEAEGSTSTTFYRSIPGKEQRALPYVAGGLNAEGQSLTRLGAIGSKSFAGNIHTGQISGAGQSATFDFGARGAHVVVKTVTTSGVANGDLTLQSSVNGSDWIDIYPISANGLSFPIQYSFRYMRMTWTGVSTAFSLASTVDYAFPGRNLAGRAEYVAPAESNRTVAFPGRGSGPNINEINTVSTTGGQMAAGTYYLRFGARGVDRGPYQWKPEKTITVAANAAINITTERWHLNSELGYRTDGFSMLVGTVPGQYTQRYEMLPKPGLVNFRVRHDFALFVFDGTKIIPPADFTSHQIAYPEPSASLVAVDETGYELDSNYSVFISASWDSGQPYVTGKRINGFDVSFPYEAPIGGGTFDWMVVR